mmetsp:Transcript_17075/g.43541  ORF Transcript_17075/g.43541 Transcript_17075/m.43541 type:complete len:81 (+) Transcript_17075:64-306(+)
MTSLRLFLLSRKRLLHMAPGFGEAPAAVVASFRGGEDKIPLHQFTQHSLPQLTEHGDRSVRVERTPVAKRDGVPASWTQG